jgi:NADPH2:quinone reductase
MAAAVLTAPGAPVYGRFVAPEPAPGKVVVDVRAAGLNPVDIAIAAGSFPGMTPQYPSVPGHEGVGMVDGQRVYFSGPVAPFGSMAQHTLVARQRTVPLPDAVDDGLAIALGTSGLAAWLSLRWRARLQPGETVLVLGATGVLGSLAVQAARLLGARWIVAAGRHGAGLRRAAELGADAVVDLDIGVGGDLVTAFRQAAGGNIDVVIDPIWGEPALAALQASGPFARHVQIGNAASPGMTLPGGALRRASASILGYSNLMVPIADRVAAYTAMLGHAAAGVMTAPVELLPLREVQQAWARQAAFAHRKLVLVP